MGGNLLSHRGELRPMATPVEEHNTQFVLKGGDRVANGGLGHPHDQSGLAEVALIGHRQEGTELRQLNFPKIHGSHRDAAA
jgi:hypothetical protein